VKQYQKDYGNSNATETARIAFAIGAHYADKDDWESARKALSAAMGTLDRAPPDIQVQAHATLARSMMHMKAQAQARGEYDRVRRIWGDGTVAQAKMSDAYKSDSEDERAHRLGKALDAVGEAMFYAAEERKKEKVDSLPYPVYKGPATKEDINKYMEKMVKPWVLKKQSAIEEVDGYYQRITELQPIPPPRWSSLRRRAQGSCGEGSSTSSVPRPFPRSGRRTPRFEERTSSTSTRLPSRSRRRKRSRRSSAASMTP
jgi:hypothetical protein